MTDISQMKLARPNSPAMDAILGFPFKALNEGFVRVVDYMGNDSAVVQAARVSYGEGTTKVSDDAALINYLLRHAHTTPFEMCSIKLHCKLPMFVARQWVRHRTASINEYSARYSILKDEFYVPEQNNIMVQSNSNKQGRDAELLKQDAMSKWLIGTDLMNTGAYNLYKYATDEGMARELARINLPVSTYTEWYWQVNLHNLMHFLRLRADSHAQYEIRVYADIIVNIMKEWVPQCHDAWLNHSFNSVKFSGKVMEELRRFLQHLPSGEQAVLKVYLEKNGVKGRELAETLSELGFKN